MEPKNSTLPSADSDRLAWICRLVQWIFVFASGAAMSVFCINWTIKQELRNIVREEAISYFEMAKSDCRQWGYINVCEYLDTWPLDSSEKAPKSLHKIIPKEELLHEKLNGYRVCFEYVDGTCCMRCLYFSCT